MKTASCIQLTAKVRKGKKNMNKRRGFSLFCVLAMLLTVIPVFAQNSGVTNLTCTKNVNAVRITWNNPSELERNVLYYTKNGVEGTPIELGKAQSYEYQPIASGESYFFTVRTYFADSTYVDESVKYYVRYNDTTTISDWTVSVLDTPDFGVTMQEAYKGYYSVYFNWNEQPDTGVYYRLYKPVTLKNASRYRLGFWFKTQGYEDGATFTYDDIVTGAKKNVIIGDDYQNGVWQYVEQDFTATATGSKNVGFNVISKGKIWFDSISLTEIDSSGNPLSTLLDTSFEREVGVSALNVTRDTNTATITWTNPTDADFSYNELYRTYKDNKILIATFRNGETTYKTDVSATGGYRFTVKSYYEGGLSGEKSVELWRNMLDTQMMPGWSLDVCDKNTYQFRGSYGITTEDVFEGKYAAYFKMNQAMESNVYLHLFRAVSLEAGKKYCFSYSFKTENYGEKDAGRFSFFDFSLGVAGDRQKVTAGAEYPNGSWHTVKAYYTATETKNKNIEIWIECYGTLWLDNIQVYEVDTENNQIGENLLTGSTTKTDGGFESEVFTQKPEKPTGCSAKAGFRRAVLSWDKNGQADQVRVYEGNTLIASGAYAEGTLNITDLTYGTHTLKVCNVSAYGVESGETTVLVTTLPYEITVPKFSRIVLTKGLLQTRLMVSNDGEKEIKVTLVVALYNGNKLESVEFVTEQLSTGMEKELITEFTVPDLSGGAYSVAAYTWDDFFAAKKAYHEIQWLK